MELPPALQATFVRDAKAKVLHSIRPLSPADVDFGQYARGTVDGQEVPGYREESDVPDDSRRETYVAMRVHIDNWRWHGVPFYIRTGKRLASRATNIAVNFLREHVADDVRIHYAITGGGAAPNIVPEEAEVWYFIRAPRRGQVDEVHERVVRCARAGALATGTEPGDNGGLHLFGHAAAADDAHRSGRHVARARGREALGRAGRSHVPERVCTRGRHRVSSFYVGGGLRVPSGSVNASSP